jgi:YVTN family beta-propeller protein
VVEVKANARFQVTWPGLTPEGAVLLPSGWSLKPAGRQLRLGSFPMQIAIHPSEPVLAVLHAGYGEHEVVTVSTQSGRILGRVSIPQSFGGLVWSPEGRSIYVGGGFDDVIYRFDHGEGLLSGRRSISYPPSAAGPRVPSGMAISADGKTLWTANVHGHSVMRIDLGAGMVRHTVLLGEESFPYGLAWDEPGGRLYVSLWNRATVAVIDTQGNGRIEYVATQEHPNEMVLARGGKILYVANANRNTVTVIDTAAMKAIETIGTAIDPAAPAGCTPNALALTPDESILFVANADTNHLSVFNVEQPGDSKPLGFIPAGWYPTSVRVSRDGKTIYATNGKGLSSAANRDGPIPTIRLGEGRTREYIGGLFQGTLSTISMPGPERMAAYTQTVYECSPIRRGEPTAVRGGPPPEGSPIPSRVGDPSPIRYVVYIVKENRTYDQVFGDLPQGNGDPNLCLFPEEVTPNHHALAREFVLLDNFYVDGEVSADGHEWSMGAYATDFVERTWPLGYRGDRRVPYPAEGKFELARPSGGYLWDQAAAKGITYRSYGEFIDNAKDPDEPGTTTEKNLQGHFDPFFRSYDLEYPDVKRAERFLQELAEFERAGEMPQLVILRLPNDHTAGTRPGAPTVMAYMGDNDLALGKVVEGLSKSRFWSQMAVFVVEDDAQNGSDHVDAHRTVALVAGPYVRRGVVDSTMYSTSSMLRTMELILGLDPMSQFDAAAVPMYASFTTEPDFRPYTHRPVTVDLNAKNPPNAPFADVSMRLNLEVEDRADDLLFNEIIWKAVKGVNSPMPPPVRAAFVIPRD